MASYSHLSIQHRQLLGKLKKQGKSLRHIARILGVAPSTVSREIKRNYTGFGYCCNLAQHKTRSRRARANQIHRKLDDEAQNFIEAKLRCKHSPEQIASQFPNRLSRNISPQSIYRFIKSYDGSRRNLRPLLRRKGKRQISKTQRHAVVRNKPSIELRSMEINDRSEFGHWEADIMEGPKSAKLALLVLVERKSRFTIIRKLPDQTSKGVSAAMINMLEPYIAKSITYDNGTEFSAYRQTSEVTGASAWFCHPYHAWEKGTVENTIGLLREYIPKKTPIPNNHKIIRGICDELNQRPRKILAFQSPYSLIQNIKKSSIPDLSKGSDPVAL